MYIRDWITIAVVVVLGAGLGAGAFLAIGVLKLRGAPEWIEFVVAMVMLVALLFASYLVVIAPKEQRDEERDTD